MDANGSTTPAAMTFYKRAKALYDANYEDDRVTIVQALILLAWWWEGPEGMYSLSARLFDFILVCCGCKCLPCKVYKSDITSCQVASLRHFNSALCPSYALQESEHAV
jgi:hypothetical protein